MRSSRRVLVPVLTALLAGAGASVTVGSPARAQTPGVYWSLQDTSTFPRIGPAPPGDLMPLLLGLTSDYDGVQAVARAVNDPTLPSYGRYPTVAELVAAYGASPAHQAAVVQAFAAVGATAMIDVSAGFATATVTVAQAEALFGATMGLYDDPGSTNDLIAPDDPTALTLPAPLVGAVEIVLGLDEQVDGGPVDPSPPAPPPPPVVYGPAAGGTPWRTGVMTGCPEATSLSEPGSTFGSPAPTVPVALGPGQVLTAYGIDVLHAAGLTGGGTRVALVETGPFDPADLAAFRACFGLGGPAWNVHGTAPPAINPEATLDVEVLAAVVPGAERLDLFLTPYDWWGPLLSGPLDAAATGGRRTDVVSVSYGSCEAGTDVGDLAVGDFVLALAAAAGITYVVSSGDSGSSGCIHGGGTATLQSASYPATSSWVTSVGGTNLTLDAANRRVSEGVWNDLQFVVPPGSGDPTRTGAGGGGPSIRIDRPTWQQGPGVPAGPARLTPDVALFADSLPGYVLRCTCPAYFPLWHKVGGTSAAAPLFAGMVALLTQAGRLQDQPDPGHVAPLLYGLARTTAGGAPFQDVTLGTNDLFGVGCCAAGPAYDQATGWGSVDATALLQALSPPQVSLTATPLGEPTDGPRDVQLQAAVTGTGTVLDYAWDLDGNGTVDRITTTPVTTATAPGPGLLGAAVTVRTSLGRSGAEAVLVVVEAPVAAAGGPPVPVQAQPRYTG